MFGWLKKKTVVTPVAVVVPGENPNPAIGTGRGWIDASGVFWFRANLSGKLKAKDVFLVDDSLITHGGETWHEPLAVLQQSGLALEAGTFPKQAVEMRKKALKDLASLSRKTFGLTSLSEDGDGVTETECVMILTDYLAWVGHVASEFLPLPVLSA